MILGKDGQVGKSLQKVFQNINTEVIFLGREDCDLTNLEKLNEILWKYKPTTIINAAAYTSVDKAESEVELVYSLNILVPLVLAQYLSQIDDGLLIHFSTDYVFSDTKQVPYLEEDAPGPENSLSTYGRSKLAGEQAIQECYQYKDGASEHNSRFYILRCSCVYGDGINFIQKIWNLIQTKEKLFVVSDQVGIATPSYWLAELCRELISKKPQSGIYHAVPDGEVSWFDLAKFVLDYARANQLNIALKELAATQTKDYPIVARRPLNSRLNNLKLKKNIPMLFEGSSNSWKNQVINYLDWLNEKHIQVQS
jgi:dTDP-4-dehydrorhamnose reductase